MRQLKMSASAQIAGLLAVIVLNGCGNKGPLIPPEATMSVVETPELAATVAETETKKQ